MKNGANGINFCLACFPHIIPIIQDINKVIANPVTPNHTPPTAINFISPSPIGVSDVFFLRLDSSNIKPIIAAKAYPQIAAIIASLMLVIHGKNAAIANPSSSKGKRYTSGIMRRRQSVSDIFHAHQAAPANKIKKKILYNPILIFIIPPCLSIRNYATIISTYITRIF